MDRDTLHREIVHGIATARMNAHYYRRRAAVWTRLDRGVRFGQAIAASAAVAGAFAADWAAPTWRVFGVLIAVLGIFGAVWQAGDTARRLSDLAARWSDAVGRFEALDRAGPDAPDAPALLNELAAEVASLDRLDTDPRDERLASEMQALVLAEMGDRWARS